MKNILLAVLTLVTSYVHGQQQSTERDSYLKTITERSQKIVKTLALNDTNSIAKVVAIVRDQYDDLNNVYIARDAKAKSIKTAIQEQSERDTALAVNSRKAQASIDKLHAKYLAKLHKHLSNEQVDAVKNGMTYNVLPITYKAYQDQILTLTEEQKKQIWTWLVEAREHAMDAESSDKKHAWFGKYKGRINNYLSKQGYDLKKEGEAWEKRRKAASSGK